MGDRPVHCVPQQYSGSIDDVHSEIQSNFVYPNLIYTKIHHMTQKDFPKYQVNQVSWKCTLCKTAYFHRRSLYQGSTVLNIQMQIRKSKKHQISEGSQYCTPRRVRRQMANQCCNQIRIHKSCFYLPRQRRGRGNKKSGLIRKN